MTRSASMIARAKPHLGQNYKRLPVVMSSAEGVWYMDADGNQYLDMLAGYSAANFGHSHPRIVRAIQHQSPKVLVVPGILYSDKMCQLAPAFAEFCGKDRAIFMNSGAEGFSTAFKMVRRWGYRKGIPENQAEIIVCHNAFHGRTMEAVSVSDDPDAYTGFGPFLEGIRWVQFGDPDDLGRSITSNTAGFILEPIQGEGGINIPPDGYLKEVVKICRKYNILSVFDEIQTGFGRTGYDLAWHHEGLEAEPDVIIVGKSFGSGLPVSAVAANEDIINVFTPGSHGSTFGGNPLACAVGLEAISILREEHMPEKSATMGRYLIDRLRDLQLRTPLIKEVRGRGLMIGMEFHTSKLAMTFKKALFDQRIICKETRETTIRFSPPLIISKSEVDWAIERMGRVLGEMGRETRG